MDGIRSTYLVYLGGSPVQHGLKIGYKNVTNRTDRLRKYVGEGGNTTSLITLLLS